MRTAASRTGCSIPSDDVSDPPVVNSQRLKVGLIGAGAMGTLFGYHLAQTCDVTILDSNADVLSAIGRDGLAVNDGAPRPVTVTSTPSDLYT